MLDWSLILKSTGNVYLRKKKLAEGFYQYDILSIF